MRRVVVAYTLQPTAMIMSVVTYTKFFHVTCPSFSLSLSLSPSLPPSLSLSLHIKANIGSGTEL